MSEQLLESLYGRSCAPEIERRLRDLIDRFVSRPGPSTRKLAPATISQRDAVLITYADQVRDGDERPLKTLARFCARHVKGIVSGIHLLPFYPWSSDDGFSEEDFFAAEPSYGTWKDNALLSSDFDLMLDGVFDHVSAQGKWFQRFLGDDPRYRDFFISVAGSSDRSQVVRPRALPLLTEFSAADGLKRVWTTFSADQVDLNFANPQVLLAALEVLLFYVAKGARFIRLDAIKCLWREIGTSCLHLQQTHQVIQLLRAVVDEVAPHVLLITETNVLHSDNVPYLGDGTNKVRLVYNFALPPLVLHSFVAGNAENLTRWAQSLAVLSDRVTFFNFLASHDGIGLKPARGILSDAEIDALVTRTLEHGGFISYKDMPDGSRMPYEMNINYLDALSNPAENEPVEVAARRFLTAHAILLSLQGMPGIYFHSMFGSRGDPAGAVGSGIPRRINREKLNRARLEAELRDSDSLRARVLAGHRELLRIRQQHTAFGPAAPQSVLRFDSRVLALLRQSRDGTDTVLCLQNVSHESVPVHLQAVLPGVQGWKTLWGGNRSPATSEILVLQPCGTSWLAAVPHVNRRLSTT